MKKKIIQFTRTDWTETILYSDGTILQRQWIDGHGYTASGWSDWAPLKGLPS